MKDIYFSQIVPHCRLDCNKNCPKSGEVIFSLLFLCDLSSLQSDCGEINYNNNPVSQPLAHTVIVCIILTLVFIHQCSLAVLSAVSGISAQMGQIIIY